MARRRVSFRTTDGRQPGRSGASQTFTLRAPIDIGLPPSGEVKLKMGLMCSSPILILNSPAVQAEGVELAEGNWNVISAEQEIVLRLKNTSKEVVRFHEGETMAQFVVLGNDDVHVVNASGERAPATESVQHAEPEAPRPVVK